MNRLLLIGINTLRGFSGPMFNFLITLFGIKFFGKEDWGTITTKAKINANYNT